MVLREANEWPSGGSVQLLNDEIANVCFRPIADAGKAWQPLRSACGACRGGSGPDQQFFTCEQPLGTGRRMFERIDKLVGLFAVGLVIISAAVFLIAAAAWYLRAVL